MNHSELHFPDELEPFDLLMLKGEANPRSRSATLTLIILDKAPAFDRTVREFERISREFVRLRQHVVIPTLPVTMARWVVDPDFQIEHHVTRQVLAAPGDRRALLDVARHVLSTPMDVARPLWEVVLVEGLKGQEGEAALLLKAHHAITDGVGGLQLLRSMYDFKPKAPQRPMPLEPVPEELSGNDLLKRGIARELAETLPRTRRSLRWLGRRGGELLSSPASTLSEWREHMASAQRLMGDPPAEPSPLLARRSINRRLFDLEFPLERIKTRAKAAGCSINDAYFAGLAAAMRLYHEANGISVEEMPVAMPVNIRKEGDPAAGNQFAGARLALPVGEKSADLRMQRIRGQVQEAVNEPALNIMDVVGPVMARLPVSLLETMSDSITGIDIQASNVPGLPEAPYFAGSKVLSFIPFGPLPGVAMMVVLYSQGGTCHLGFHYDTDAFDNPELLEKCLLEGFDETLGATARRRAPRKKKPQAKSPTGTRPKTRPAAKKTGAARAVRRKTS